MLGRFGECLLRYDAACGQGVFGDKASVNAVNKGHGHIGGNGFGNIGIGIESAKPEHLGAAADGSELGQLGRFGINGIECAGGIIMRPVQPVGVHIPCHGLRVLHLNAGKADVMAHCGILVDAVKLSEIADAEHSTLIIYRNDDDWVAMPHGVAVRINEFGNIGHKPRCAIDGIKTAKVVIAVIGGKRIHDILGIVVCHAVYGMECKGARTGVGKGPCIGINGIEPDIRAVAVVVIAVDRRTG